MGANETMNEQREHAAAADAPVELGGRRLTLDDLAYLNRVTTVGQVLPNVAHELNNALQVVGGLVEMLATRVDLPPDVHEKLGRIAAQAGRATGMIRDLVVFARRDDGGVRVVDLAKMVDAALGLRRYHLSRARVAVTVRGADSGALLARVDAHYVLQVLLNLLINAEHSMAGRDGAHIEIDLAFAGEGVSVTVADNGPGFAPGVKERALDPFFTTKGIAAGLGLTVAERLMRAQGGCLMLAGRADGGTAATLTLPAWRG
jgi:signal transduction histidine kinase